MSERESIARHDETVASQNQKDLIGLCTEARRGGISRRQFIERALLLGLSASAVGALAGACGTKETATPAGTVPPMDETKPSQVVFYNWTDYLAPEIAKGFEKESGIKVQESYFSTNEEMLAKFKAGATGYDVVVPSDWMVSVMTKSGLLEPLDMDYLPNFQYVGEQFKVPSYDDPAQNDGLKYSVPYFYGSTGYVRRTDKIAQELTDWTPLFDAQYKGRINMLDNPRETIGVGLFSLGLDPNTTVQKELDAATAKMIEQKPLVATYDSVNQKRAIAQGQYLTHCWDGDALMAIDVLGGGDKARKLVDFVRPTEGFYTWIDNLVCPIGNGSRYGAHLWMDYLMDPKVAGTNASWIWYLSAVTPASWEYTDPFALSLKPTDEELARSEVSVDVGEFQRAYDEAWRQIKSA
jgi:spermidine/putrescine transport system substrate-binding protein